MTSQPCEGCGESVRIAGGMTLELDDGGEYFLCYDCIARLPDDRAVTSDDIESL